MEIVNATPVASLESTDAVAGFRDQHRGCVARLYRMWKSLDEKKSRGTIASEVVMDDDRAMETLEALDRWLEDDDDGVIPAEILEQHGIRLPAADHVDDAALHEQLLTVIQAMAEIGMYLESTDHLSDRELYDHIEKVILCEPTFLAPDDPLFGTHCDIIGGFDEADIRIYLTYYADERTRERWRADFNEELPPSLPHPYDRDRFLPTHEERAFDAIQVV